MNKPMQRADNAGNLQSQARPVFDMRCAAGIGSKNNMYKRQLFFNCTIFILATKIQ
ncbi:MAG: hypothetical protein ACRYGK_10800 [Janthinobacterium lividum]